jgi:tubulin polyglutamylase TTLL6/13
MSNMFIHLTNYALNKDNKDFKQAESIDDERGHKRSVTSLWKRLNGLGKDTNSILEEINDLVIKTMLSI